MFLSNILTLAKGKSFKVAAVLVAIVTPIAIAAGSASADGWCNYDSNNQEYYCLNTNNGYNVVTCENDGNCYTPEAEWEIWGVGNNLSEIFNENFANGCVGDLGNSSSNASAGIDECPSQGSAGWGTKFYAESCANSVGAYGYAFQNYHWVNGMLGPASWTNGAKYYLNNANVYCFADNTTM